MLSTRWTLLYYLTTLSISDLSPYTTYTCYLSVMKGLSGQCNFTTAQDSKWCQHIRHYHTNFPEPDDDPQDFTSSPTKTNVTFKWKRPATPNGVITHYNLTVVNLATSNTTSYLIDVTPNQETVARVIDGFSPYQNYTATITASTVIGYGPAAITSGRTLSDSKDFWIIDLAQHIFFMHSSQST